MSQSLTPNASLSNDDMVWIKPEIKILSVKASTLGAGSTDETDFDSASDTYIS